MSVLIAIDQGTTSTRTVAYDKDLNIDWRTASASVGAGVAVQGTSHLIGKGASLIGD